MVRLVKINGERGRWVAEVEGQWLAVLHHTQRIGPHDHFMPLNWGDPRKSRRYQEFEDALKTHDLAVIQRDGDPITLSRDGYVGVFRFANLQIDYSSGIRLRFTERYASPQR